MVDLTHQGMGLRCKRFMCVVEDGVVTHTRVGKSVAPVSAAAAEKALDDTKESGPRRGGLFEKLLGREVAARAAEAEAANSESEGLLHVSGYGGGLWTAAVVRARNFGACLVLFCCGVFGRVLWGEGAV